MYINIPSKKNYRTSEEKHNYRFNIITFPLFQGKGKKKPWTSIQDNYYYLHIFSSSFSSYTYFSYCFCCI